MDLKLEMKERCAYIEAALEKSVPEQQEFPPVIFEAMRYSLLAGGKRLRPVFVYDFNNFAWNYLCNEFGYVEEEDEEKMVSVKTVLEWIEDMSEYTGIDSETLKESFLKKIDL